MKPITLYTCRLEPPQAEALERRLRQAGYEFHAVPHARFAAERERVKIVFYASGKLVVQGKDTAEFVEFILEPEILRRAGLGYESVLNPERSLPRIGVDESGKGDFFGPLCVAGAYVNERMLRAWEELGVRDSKAIGSDRRVAELARSIRETPGAVTEVVTVGNAAYNRLYGKMRNVNSILAWGHARVIENLMARRHRMDPPPVRVISDQFAASKATVARALMPLGRQVELIQRHKAESDLAVAAASILARDQFLQRLAALGREFGLALPKGAGAQADAAARELTSRHGLEVLAKAAKTHFRNALRVGQPAASEGG